MRIGTKRGAVIPGGHSRFGMLTPSETKVVWIAVHILEILTLSLMRGIPPSASPSQRQY